MLYDKNDYRKLLSVTAHQTWCANVKMIMVVFSAWITHCILHDYRSTQKICRIAQKCFLNLCMGLFECKGQGHVDFAKVNVLK